jgi:uncharacterized protein
MRDGVCLSTNIFRPDQKARVPALPIRTPYGKEVDYNDPTARIRR